MSSNPNLLPSYDLSKADQQKRFQKDLAEQISALATSVTSSIGNVSIPTGTSIAVEPTWSTILTESITVPPGGMIYGKVSIHIGTLQPIFLQVLDPESNVIGEAVTEATGLNLSCEFSTQYPNGISGTFTIQAAVGVSATSISAPNFGSNNFFSWLIW